MNNFQNNAETIKKTPLKTHSDWADKDVRFINSAQK